MTDITERLWNSDEASALTNESAREIEKLREIVKDLMFLAEAEHVCLVSWNGSGSAANYDGIMERAASMVRA